jgi:hypothetical protein
MDNLDIACVRIIAMRHHHDCVVCCLAMLLGVSYDAALLAVSKVSPESGAKGLFWTQAKKAAKHLNYTLVTHRSKDFQNLTGILGCTPDKDSMEIHEHAVILLRGIIIDPQHGEVWDDIDAYLTANRYKPGTLLVRKSII